MRIVTSKVLSQTDSEGGKAIKDKLAKLLKYTKADIVFQVNLYHTMVGSNNGMLYFRDFSQNNGIS